MKTHTHWRRRTRIDTSLLHRI